MALFEYTTPYESMPTNTFPESRRTATIMAEYGIDPLRVCREPEPDDTGYFVFAEGSPRSNASRKFCEWPSYAAREAVLNSMREDVRPPTLVHFGTPPKSNGLGVGNGSI